jgi:hypothetical protein
MAAQDVFEAVGFADLIKWPRGVDRGTRSAPPSDDLPAEIGLTELERLVAAEF